MEAVLGPVMTNVLKSSLSYSFSIDFAFSLPTSKCPALLTYLTNVVPARANRGAALSNLCPSRLEVGAVLAGGGAATDRDCPMQHILLR